MFLCILLCLYDAVNDSAATSPNRKSTREVWTSKGDTMEDQRDAGRWSGNRVKASFRFYFNDDSIAHMLVS